MAEYIERESLLEEIDRRFEESPIENTNAWMVGRRIVRKFPAADVEPVRHGHWIKHERYVVDSDGEPVLKTGEEFECSLCGRIEKEKEPYCNCGAKMDGKV